ncbi:endo-1,4-beta-xylanase [uncultured Proteiniphilum sp.]|uniref:endo-1,4-beta-xylanase n=1 Tax=uncultured Proteiniphilum sp. TaxID=497637 RepID=UPI00263731D8|nr:endo-1,4-beta-xylanase [uncultured Proteiniphilum sp.]
MKSKSTLLIIICLICSGRVFSQNSESVMSDAYFNFWNEQVQNKISADIEKNRKSDAVLKFENLPAGTQIEIKQISHDFLFGGNIFLFGDCGSPKKNKKYEETFGDLFNAATIPFYWKTLEPEQGNLRFEAGSSYEYRRPPTDPVVDFCESKGINMNGHAIIYGMRRWGHPTWMPEDREIMEEHFEKHIRKLAERYKGRIQRWDVVNEPTDQANRGAMPDDYTYKSFRWAMEYFPDLVKFNINDSDMHWDMTLYRRYLEIVRNLIDRGIRLDYVGLQMHIFNPDESRKIADGADILTPEKIYKRLDLMSEAGRPLHVSEVTVSAPDDSEEGKAIQAEITKNFYRLWFSHSNVMGITWWNVVDGGAAPGEPSFSGIYDKELRLKPVYHVLDELINNEWRTQTIVKTSNDGVVKFRGFKGRYVVSWKDKSGNRKQTEFDLLKNGDGFEVF